MLASPGRSFDPGAWQLLALLFSRGALPSLPSSTRRKLPITCLKVCKLLSYLLIFGSKIENVWSWRKHHIVGKEYSKGDSGYVAKDASIVAVEGMVLHLRVQLPFLSCKTPLPFIFSICCLLVHGLPITCRDRHIGLYGLSLGMFLLLASWLRSTFTSKLFPKMI